MVHDDGFLQFGDMRLDLDVGLGAELVLDKTHGSEFVRTPRLGPHLPRELDWLCAKAALLRFLTSASDWSANWKRDPVRRLWPVFPVIRHGRCTSERCGSANARAAP